MKRLYEKKDHLIKRNPNLTDAQKSEIIELLGRHPSYENKIDWNKSNSLTYEDFLKVLRPLYINELDPRGLEEGWDYDIVYKSEGEILYFVYTYEASKILASNSVGPELWTKIPNWCGEEEKTDEAHAFGYFDPEHGNMKPGAKWCISMQTSKIHWDMYSPKFHFLFWFRDNPRFKDNRKIAIGIRKTTWEVALLYNGADEGVYGVETLEEEELPSYIKEILDKERDAYKEKEKERNKKKYIKLISKYNLSLNPKTNRYDYDGNLKRSILRNFVSEDRNGFTINFGKITGDFDCSDLGLKSLKGVPIEVTGGFICSENQIASLKGSPQKVGWFDCSGNGLTSLEGIPKEISEDFFCYSNHLTSLKGAPDEVNGIFDCSMNQLTSLEGAPQKIKGDFYCSYNQLTSLEGAPEVVVGNFYYLGNPNLNSLEGIGKVEGEILRYQVY